jgi:hypothetical protein
LLIAYSLIVLMVLLAAGTAWWKIHHSRHRTEARQRAFKHAAAVDRLAAAKSKDDHG